MYNRLHIVDKGTFMKAARYHGRLDIRIEDLPVPTPAADELLVQVTAVGICGTDAGEFVNGPTLFPIEHPHAVTGHCGPMVPGHEFAGVVAGAGGGVSGFAEGDLITSGAGVSCGTCRACRAGRTNLCARYFTVGLNRDGALAEFTTVPASACLNVSTDACPATSPRWPSRCRSPCTRCDVAIPVGMTAWSSSVPAGSVRSSCTPRRGEGADVAAIDLDADRLAVASELGAAATVQTTRDAALDEVLASLPTSPTVIYECTGVPSAVQAAIGAVEQGGRVVVVGLHKHPVPVDLLAVSLNEKEVVGTLAHVFDADFGHAVDLLEEGDDLWSRVAPTVVPLDDLLDKGLRPMIEGGETPIKLLLDPRIDHVRQLEVV